MSGLPRPHAHAQADAAWILSKLLDTSCLQTFTRNNLHHQFLYTSFQQLRRNAHVALKTHDFRTPKPGTKIEGLVLLIKSHLRPSNLHVRSAPTTLIAQPTTLQGHTYDPETRMSGAHLRPSQLHLRPFKVTPTTLKPACQEPTYDPHSSTYDPSRSHLRP